MFSTTFIAIMIIGSIVWTGLGALTLLILLIKDHRGRSIW